MGCGLGACIVGCGLSACIVGCGLGACIVGCGLGACIVGCGLDTCIVGCVTGGLNMLTSLPRPCLTTEKGLSSNYGDRTGMQKSKTLEHAIANVHVHVHVEVYSRLFKYCTYIRVQTKPH